MVMMAPKPRGHVVSPAGTPDAGRGNTESGTVASDGPRSGRSAAGNRPRVAARCSGTAPDGRRAVPLSGVRLELGDLRCPGRTGDLEGDLLQRGLGHGDGTGPGPGGENRAGVTVDDLQAPMAPVEPEASRMLTF